jgi:hypothetical protein
VAHPKQDQVRRRYGFRCGYCGVSESDVGSELTVDHFQPVTVGGDESEENLVYCCFKCNLYKSDFFPSPEDLQHGRRLLHPLRDDSASFFRENMQSGELEPLNETGRFHIQLLQLNRPALIECRLSRQLLGLLSEKQKLLEIENAHLRETIVALERYISGLRTLLGFPFGKND